MSYFTKKIAILGLLASHLSLAQDADQELQTQQLQNFLGSYCSKPADSIEGSKASEELVDWYCPPVSKNKIEMPESAYADWKKIRDGYLAAMSGTKFDPAKPDGPARSIQYIVLHNTEESFVDTLGIFSLSLPFRRLDAGMDEKDPATYKAVKARIRGFSGVSIHFVVARDGTVVRNIKDSDSANHSGDKSINSTAIGIEIEASLFNPPARIKAGGMTDLQEQKVVKLVKYLQETYGVASSNIIQHRYVSGSECPKSVFPVSSKGRDSFFDWRDANFGNTGEATMQQRLEAFKSALPELDFDGLNPDLPGAELAAFARSRGKEAAEALHADLKFDCLANTYCVDMFGSPTYLFDELGNRQSGMTRKVLSYLICKDRKIKICKQGCVKSPAGKSDDCFDEESPDSVVPVDLFSSPE